MTSNSPAPLDSASKIEILDMVIGVTRDFRSALEHHAWDRWEGIPTRNIEDAIEPATIAMADALRPLRGDDGTLRPIGLKTTGEKAMKGIGGLFDRLIARWEWGEVIGPDRERYRQGRIEFYDQKFERPYLEAVLSWRDGAPGRHPAADDEKDRALSLGYSPTMTAEEAFEEVDLRRGRWNGAPRIGGARPTCDAPELQEFTEWLRPKFQPHFRRKQQRSKPLTSILTRKCSH